MITCNITAITMQFKANVFLSVNFIDFPKRGNMRWQAHITLKVHS